MDGADVQTRVYFAQVACTARILINGRVAVQVHRQMDFYRDMDTLNVTDQLLKREELNRYLLERCDLKVIDMPITKIAIQPRQISLIKSLL